MASRKYDLAISFAGEDRQIVEKIATKLAEAGYKIFYDLWEVSDILGRDLAVYFDDVYRNRSRYCAIFVSSDYVRKTWPRHEFRSALARKLEEQDDYILPLRLDDVALEGLRPTVGYLDLRNAGIEHAVAILKGKLGSPMGVQSSTADLHSVDSGVRRAAVIAVAMEKSVMRLGELRRILLRDPDSAVRSMAAWAIDCIGDICSKDELLLALCDSDWTVRSNAGWALVHLGKPIVSDVRKLLHDSPSEDAREMAGFVLERI
jgi:HEAT repeat protein